VGDSHDLRLSHDGKKQLENQHRCFQLAQSATAVEDAAKQQTNWNHKTWEFCGVRCFNLEKNTLFWSQSQFQLCTPSQKISWGCCTIKSKVTLYQQPLPSVKKFFFGTPENLQQRGTARVSDLSQALTPCLRRTEWSDQHIGKVEIFKSKLSDVHENRWDYTTYVIFDLTTSNSLLCSLLACAVTYELRTINRIAIGHLSLRSHTNRNGQVVKKGIWVPSWTWIAIFWS